MHAESTGIFCTQGVKVAPVMLSVIVGPTGCNVVHLRCPSVLEDSPDGTVTSTLVTALVQDPPSALNSQLPSVLLATIEAVYSALAAESNVTLMGYSLNCSATRGKASPPVVMARLTGAEEEKGACNSTTRATHEGARQEHLNGNAMLMQSHLLTC